MAVNNTEALFLKTVSYRPLESIEDWKEQKLFWVKGEMPQTTQKEKVFLSLETTKELLKTVCTECRALRVESSSII